MSNAKSAPRTARIERCPACDAADTKEFFRSPDRLHGTPGEFTYEICARCRSVFQNPMVVDEDLYLCYPPEYMPYNVERELPDVDFDNLPTGGLAADVRRAVVDTVRGRRADGLAGAAGRLLSRFAPIRERAFYGLVPDQMLPRGGGEQFALDLGCGAGWLMRKLEKVGWTAEGVEWNEAAAERARVATGCRVYAGDFRTLDLTKGRYGLIVLNHVFEHFRDQRDVLRRVRELLADGGILALFFPNPLASGARWHETDWFPWEVPRHLVMPSTQAVRLMAREAGFTSFDVATRAYYSEEHWIRSKAYQLGLDPESDRPELSFAERFGCLAERVTTAFGLDNGWETVATLRK